jgi:MinD superfamily P-loop ATPase
MNIAIASGKGGTGKTTIATNLASYMAENENIILCDLDVEEPNSGIFIKANLMHQETKYKMIPDWIAQNCTLCGDCQEVCNFNAIFQLASQIKIFPQLCHSCYACSELCPTNSLAMTIKEMGILRHYKNGKLNFIESRLNIGEEQAVPLISQTIGYVNNFTNGEIKIFDSPPGTSCPVIEATKDADFVILVTEPTPFGLHDLKLAVETMRQLKKEIAVVINRYGIGNDDVIDYCEKENVPIIAKIPHERHLAELYSKGKLVYKKIPMMRKQLANIKEYIFNLIK